VGFRPFVYRLAVRHGIVGRVQNRLGEVDIVASGAADELRRFEEELVTKAPPLSRPVITRVTTAAANCRIRPTGATVTRLSTAPSAARVIR
jgi:hydrogenase maturation protein HypF